ncbi:MAG: flavin-containing monooxygenase [Gammaproteobacteria bacterium]
MTDSVLEVAIIGSGFSGIGMGIQLKKAGIKNFQIFERAADLGGTWRDNTYPGCACDVPSHLYSFSFEPNPNWPRKYSPFNEIFAYLKRCFDKHGLAKNTLFNADVSECTFDEHENEWVVKTKGGEAYRAKFLVAGTGPLNKPIIPTFPGVDTFEGESFHSSEWNHDYDLTGKNVAVVGTGASAIQIVPAIAGSVKKLSLFQRTPPWIIPRWDREISPFEQALYKWVPPLRWLYRNLIYWYLEQSGLAFVTNIGAHKNVEKLARWHMKKAIDDPTLRKKVTPDYRIGCKRILISDDYYPALTRDNVDVVTDAISKFDKSGIVTADGKHHPLDAVIYGTGFAATEFVTPMKIYGLDGKELSQHWKHSAETLLGIATAGFPNFFFLVGPNTGLGHNSMVFMIEAQINYIISCLKTLRRNNSTRVELRPDIQHAFSEELQTKMEKTAWMSGCKSWYLSADGKNYTLWPGFTVSYWFKTRKFNPEHYRLS